MRQTQSKALRPANRRHHPPAYPRHSGYRRDFLRVTKEILENFAAQVGVSARQGIVIRMAVEGLSRAGAAQLEIIAGVTVEDLPSTCPAPQ